MTARPATVPAMPTLEELQHWTWVMGRAQQMMMEAALSPPPEGMPVVPGFNDPATMGRVRDFWSDSMKLWQRFVDPAAEPSVAPKPDRRFKAEQWQSPLFDWIRQSYQVISDHMLRGVDAIEGVDPKQKEQIRFAAQGFIDAMSPTNFPATNPEVLDKIVETRGENLLKGLQNMLADMGRGQLTHSDRAPSRSGATWPRRRARW
ncbi:hypothetical protein GCM10020258_16340 [Sphingomonas yabuuchiae]